MALATQLKMYQPRELFDSNEVERFEGLVKSVKDSMNKSRALASTGDIGFEKGTGLVKSERLNLFESIEKLGGDPTDVLTKAAWDIGSPIATTPIQYEGITPYGLEPNVLMVVPKELQLRNSTPRQLVQGQGIAYRRVTAVSNSGGSIANQSIFFNSTSTSATINGVTLNVPPLTSQAGDSTFKPYVEQGLSTAVSMRQQFMSQGFTDAQALAMLTLIWSDMLGEERAMLNGRSTALSVTGVTASAATQDGGGTGLPAATATAVYVTFSSSYGESKAINTSSTPTTATDDSIAITWTGTPLVPAGTLAINVYANYSGTYYKGTTSNIATGAYPATFATVAALPSTSTDNGSYDGNGYDGMITEFNNSALGGYQLSLNAALSSATPGTEFTTALETLYVQQGADPDFILTTGSIAKVLFDLLQTGNSTNANRVNLISGDRGIIMGGAVAGIVNPATSKAVDIKVHRYMPNGVAVIHSLTPPWADSGISSCMKVVGCLDTMVIDWPQITMDYLRSTYRIGTLIFEAPVLSGIITNILD